MKENEEKKILDEAEKNIKPKKTAPKKITEISPEAAEERKLLSAFLLDKTEELRKERNERQKRF